MPSRHPRRLAVALLLVASTGCWRAGFEEHADASVEPIDAALERDAGRAIDAGTEVRVDAGVDAGGGEMPRDAGPCPPALPEAYGMLCETCHGDGLALAPLSTDGFFGAVRSGPEGHRYSADVIDDATLRDIYERLRVCAP